MRLAFSSISNSKMLAFSVYDRCSPKFLGLIKYASKIFKMAENVNSRHYYHFSIFYKFLFNYQFMFYDDIISNV